MIKLLIISCLLSPLLAQVTPAPGACSMGHCNPQMSDFVPQMPPGLSGSVYVSSNDPWNGGVGAGDGCVANGTYAVCAYKQWWNSLVAYDGDGNTVWSSGGLLDNQTFAGMPIIQADGSVVAADDQHLYKFEPDGSVTWATPTPGGVPIGLVPTPNGAIVIGTGGRELNQCWQNNCTLAFDVNNGGSGYTTASVILVGGYCPGATATATISGGSVTSVVATSQGSSCLVAPGVIIVGNGFGAAANAVLAAAAPVSVYSGMTGALVGSTFLYQNGTSGPYYATVNTACVNNGSYPNRLYFLTQLTSDESQGALWALDIDPNNLANPISPAWKLVFHGPSGASPLCVGDHVYFDGAGITPGDRVGTTIFGITDNGTSGSFLFKQSLGLGSLNITCNYALDPRPIGGFWHQVKYDPNIYHRSFTTGSLIETVNVSDLLIANGAPSTTSYWQAGVFTTYGTPDRPYLILPEAARVGSLGYIAMLDVAALQLVWAVPLAGNDQTRYDTPGGDAVLVHNSSGNPVLVVSGKQTGAYFITEGGASSALSSNSLSFGTQVVGSSSVSQSVTLTNSASSLLTINGINVSGQFAATNTCGATLAPGTSCTITVTFNPTAAGAQSGSVTVASNSAASPQAVALSGMGSAATAALTLSANQLSFPAQSAGTTSPPQAVTVSNTGAVGLSIAGISVSGAAAQNNNCPTNLAPGGSCTVNVMLAAPLLGACSGTVAIATNDPAGPQSIAANGSCVALPSVESVLATTSLVFAPRSAGTVSPVQNVKLSNIGTLALSITSITASGEVTVKNNCGKTLALAANCAISIAFAPTATGPRSGTVTVIDAAPDSPHVIAVSGLGLPNPVPVVNQPLLPTSVLPGSPGLNVTVNGSGFVSGSVVYWNGTPRVTTYIGSSQVSATLTAGDVANPATGGISVVNPSPGGGQSNVVWLPVVYPSAIPVLTTTALPAGAGPVALLAADLNGDGKLDLAVANSLGGTVSVFAGHGDGTFAAQVDYPTGSQPAGVAVGDLNHDGLPDLVVVNQGDSTVSVLLGSGGAFGTSAAYATGIGPVAVTVADLNGDGNPDLAVANQTDNTVSILFGNGDGTFAAHLDYPAGPNPRTLVAADFNADGKLDLAVANEFVPGGTVTVLLNHGEGSYLPGVAYATGDSVSLVAADLNGDGKLDLAAVNQEAQTLSVYVGNGNGGFTLGPYQTTHLAPNLMGLALADMDGYGSLEMMVATNSGNGLTVLQNNSAVSIVPLMQYGTGTGMTAMALGDFNNDGSIDVALAAPGSNQVLLLTQSPSVALSSTSLSFGSTAVGGSATKTVTLSNSGSALLTVTNISAGGAFSQTNNCTGGIVPGNSCTITVTFTPADTSAQNGVLTIADNAAGGSQTINLSGAGTALGVAISLPLNTVIGGNALTANTITLSGPAPAGGVIAYLSSSNPTLVSVPASVSVPEGATSSANFTITTWEVAANTPVTITASLGDATSNSTLTVTPIGVTVSLASTGVYGGNSLTSNKVKLANPAPAGGLVFSLSTSNPSIATVPASVTIAAGATASPDFTITTVGVASTTTVTLYANLTGLGTLASATISVYQAKVTSLTLSPASVISGLTTTGNVVNLAGLAPAGGAVITLSSYRPNAASVPASVTVPANSSVSPSFTITTGSVTTSTQVTLKATYLGTSVTAVLTVNPNSVASVNLTSASVVGGSAATTSNTVTLLAPAPSAGATVALSSSNPAVAAVPASVNVAPGATISRTFTITTLPVSIGTIVTVSATYKNVVTSVTLTVNPLLPSSLNLYAASVKGGKSFGGNTVSLNAAPGAGATVTLSSSNPAVASVPASVTLAPGHPNSPAFTVSTSAVTSQTAITISATYQGVTVTADLAVTP